MTRSLPFPGCLISGITTENVYDSLDQLTGTTISNATGTVSETENLYNGNGKRIKKTVTAGANEDITNYFYMNDIVAYTTDEDYNKKSNNIIGANDNIIFTKRYDGSYAGKYYFLNKDVRGSTTSVLNDTGTFVTGFAYDEFGVTEQFGSTNFENEVCYTGGIYDKSTGQYYLNARYYNPDEGRFLNMDTYRGENTNPQSLHLFAYCQNNPINFVDPSGHNRMKIVQKYKRGTYRWGCLKTTKSGVKKIRDKFKEKTYWRQILNFGSSFTFQGFMEKNVKKTAWDYITIGGKKAIRFAGKAGHIATIYDTLDLINKLDRRRIYNKINKYYKSKLKNKKKSSTVYFCTRAVYPKNKKIKAFKLTGAIQLHLKKKHSH